MTEDSRIHLDANESFLPLPAPILEELAGALSQVRFNRYPDPAAGELCRAFASYYGVPVECVAAGNGSDELITVLFTGFLQRGEAFATLEPDFSMYAFNGHLQEARHVAIPKRDDCSLDIDGTIGACRREKVKLLIFSNPGNPTSLVCPREEVRRLLTQSAGYPGGAGRGLYGFFRPKPAAGIPGLHQPADRTDLSKAFGMASLRLGFAVGQKRLVDAVKAVKSPYNVNSLSQKLGALVLGHPQAMKDALETILSSRDALLAGVRALEGEFPGRFDLLPSATNFITLRMPDGEERLYQYLGRTGHCHPVHRRAGADYLRRTGGRPSRRAGDEQLFCRDAGSRGVSLWNVTLRCIEKPARQRSPSSCAWMGESGVSLPAWAFLTTC